MLSTGSGMALTERITFHPSPTWTNSPFPPSSSRFSFCSSSTHTMVISYMVSKWLDMYTCFLLCVCVCVCSPSRSLSECLVPVHSTHECLPLDLPGPQHSNPTGRQDCMLNISNYMTYTLDHMTCSTDHMTYTPDHMTCSPDHMIYLPTLSRWYGSCTSISRSSSVMLTYLARRSMGLAAEK